ncbi:MAG: ferredoxin family protein [Candidatus Omnitrophota bacterium]|jgi:NAD-dependent dihydropyrimidine dehydrogenase PreA subunit|nr:MAG: ferredoxin family protein [Candidatus Omnitrophota bacterium]
MDTQPSLCVILYEGQGSAPFEADTRFEVARAVLDRGYEIMVSNDCAALTWVSNKHFLVLGNFSAVPPALNEPSGFNPHVHIHPCDHNDGGQILQILDTYCERNSIRKPGGWTPWFPTIDYDRCVNCHQCLSFCLFDVYGLDAQGRIKVQNPIQCKTDCPACSRICPESAIIFPKYKNEPINGGEVQEDQRREKVKVDLSALLSGDIHESLRNRTVKAKTRFSSDRDEQKALQERKNCIKKLQDELDIPDTVLMSLPVLEAKRTKVEPKK